MTTKMDIVAFYSELHNIKDFTKAESKIDRFINTLETAFMTNEKIIFRNFGTFEIKETKARKIVDPKDSTNIIDAKPKKYIKFKVSRLLKENLCLM